MHSRDGQYLCVPEVDPVFAGYAHGLPYNFHADPDNLKLCCEMCQPFSHRLDGHSELPGCDGKKLPEYLRTDNASPSRRQALHHYRRDLALGRIARVVGVEENVTVEKRPCGHTRLLDASSG